MNAEYKGVLKHFLADLMGEKKQMENFPELYKACMNSAGTLASLVQLDKELSAGQIDKMCIDVLVEALRAEDYTIQSNAVKLMQVASNDRDHHLEQILYRERELL
jgi:hypothetical protein